MIWGCTKNWPKVSAVLSFAGGLPDLLDDLFVLLEQLALPLPLALSLFFGPVLFD